MLESPAKIFEQPEAREKLREAAQLANAMDKKRASRSTGFDLQIVQLGMLPASP